MVRLLIIQDPDSLRLLLQPVSKFLTNQVALVIVDNETCEHGAGRSDDCQAGAPTQPLDCDVYRHVSRRDVTEWVPARVAVADDGRPYLREDVVCFNVCASGQLVPEDLAGQSRSIAGHTETIVRASNVELDPMTHRVYRRGREIHLGPTEFRLLQVLLQNPDHVMTREQLLAAVWGSKNDIDERTVDVHVGRLRKALNQRRDRDLIRTVRGVGYAFDAGERPRTSTNASPPLDEQRELKSC